MGSFMRRLLLALAILSISSPAWAQDPEPARSTAEVFTEDVAYTLSGISPQFESCHEGLEDLPGTLEVELHFSSKGYLQSAKVEGSSPELAELAQCYESFYRAPAYDERDHKASAVFRFSIPADGSEGAFSEDAKVEIKPVIKAVSVSESCTGDDCYKVGGRIGTTGGASSEVLGKVKGIKIEGKARDKDAVGSASSQHPGTLSREQVLSVIGQHMGKIQSCYEQSLEEDPELAGKITFEWVVAEDGKVASPEVVSDTMGTPQVSACILKIIKDLKFAEPEGGSAQVRFPFIFKAS